MQPYRFAFAVLFAAAFAVPLLAAPPQAPPVDPRIGQAAADIDEVTQRLEEISADLKRLQGALDARPTPAVRTIASKCSNPLCDCADCDCGPDCPCGRVAVGRPQRGPDRPLDEEAMRRAIRVTDEDFQTSVAVPKSPPVVVDTRAGHWSVASARSEWNPSKSEAIAHLRREHPSKAQNFEPLESLSLESILTLHDDAHEGRNSTVSRSAGSSATYATPTVSTRPVSTPVYSGGCPGGVCPTGGATFSGGCPGGNCPTSRGTSGGWYLGKNIGW